MAESSGKVNNNKNDYINNSISLFFNYIKSKRIIPTTVIIPNNIFTDFKYFFVLELVSFFENAPAPKEMTK